MRSFVRFELDIDYPLEKMESSRRRLEARARFEIVDRVPVNFCLVPRFFAPIFKIAYKEIFRDARTQYHWLLQFAKYGAEHVPSDLLTEPTVVIQPYFDNVVDADAFGGEVSGRSTTEIPEPIRILIPILRCDAALVSESCRPSPLHALAGATSALAASNSRTGGRGASAPWLKAFWSVDGGDRHPPVGRSEFVGMEGMPSDHYLWLTGQGGRLLRREIEVTGTPTSRQSHPAETVR
jgi:hypothetical protein